VPTQAIGTENPPLAFDQRMVALRSRLLSTALRLWLPAAAAATVAAGLVYGEAQHLLRSSANDPQIQMAQDAAARLDAGASPSAVVPTDSVELATSLAPYLIVFDGSGHVLASSVTVRGRPPDFPESVFTNVSPAGVETVTWRTSTGERSATAVTGYSGGYVVAGRSLREVESRDNDSLLLAVGGWVAMLGAAALAALGAALLGPHS
jgi:hypothetical protein